MERGFRSRLPAIVLLACAAVMSWVVALVSVGFVESRSYSAVRSALELEDVAWANVTVDGLRVTLSGTAPSEAMRFRALSLAGSVVDPTRVFDEMSVTTAAQTLPRFSIEILRNDDGVSLIGLVPADLDRSALAYEIGEQTSGARLNDLLQSADYPAPGGWDEALAFSLKALGILGRSKISVSAGQVEVSAISDSEADKRRLSSRLKAVIPAGLDVAIDITAPRPAITPFTLRFVANADGTAHFDACSVDTPQASNAVLAAAVGAGAPRDTACTMGLGSPSPRWGEAAVASIKAVRALGGGTVTISDSDVALQSLPGVDQVLFDTVVGTLDRDLPDAFSLEAQRVAAEVSEGAPVVGAIEVFASKSAEGAVLMRGLVSGQRDHKMLDAYAKGLFGIASLNNVTRVGDTMPEGWALRVMAGLEALSHLDNGQVTVREGEIVLKGETGSTATRGEVTRLLTAKLGEGATLALDVTYVKKLDPLLGLPTPLECVQRINAVLAAEKLKFAPGSGEIEAGSANALNNLADAFKDCEEVKMEVAGHTDSQGRDEMNLQLSQSRADAVIGALMVRRVLTSQLTARGYGETQPIADNETEEGREANRRIEFRLTAEDGRIVVTGAQEDRPATTTAEEAAAGGETPVAETGGETPPVGASGEDALPGSGDDVPPPETAVAEGTDVPPAGESAAPTVPVAHPELDPKVAPDAIPKPRPEGLGQAED